MALELRGPALVLDLDETLVPLHNLPRWQWAWRPSGPAIPERHAASAIRRALRSWDRRRWRGLTGAEPAVTLDDHRRALGAELLEIADRPLPDEEVALVVERFLKPLGPLERPADLPPLLEALGRLGGRYVVLSSLPASASGALLQRIGLPADRLVAIGPDEPAPPDRSAFRRAAAQLGVRPSAAAFVGDLYWSDVRAAARAGLRSILLDREGRVPPASGERIASLAELPERLARPPPEPPTEGEGAPAPDPGAP